MNARALSTAVVIAALTFMFPAVASADSAWVPTVNVASGTNSLESSDMVTDSAGNAMAVWTFYPSGVIQTAFKPAGGSWQAPVNVSSNAYIHSSVNVVSPAAGKFTVAWQENASGLQHDVFSSNWDGSWSIGTLVSDTGTQSDGVQLSARSDGSVVALYYESASGGWDAFARVLPLGGNWGTPVTLTQATCPTYIDGLSLASSSDDTTIASWLCVDLAPSLMESAILDATGNWGSAAGIPAVWPMTYSNLRTSATGPSTFAAVWTQTSVTPSSASTLELSRYTEGSGWSAPITIYSSTDVVLASAFVSTLSGELRLAAVDYALGKAVAINVTSAGPSPATPMSAAIVSISGPVVVDPDGTATYFYLTSDNTTEAVATRIQRADGSWQPEQVLTTDDSQSLSLPLAARTPSNDLVTVWSRNTDPSLSTVVLQSTWTEIAVPHLPETGSNGFVGAAIAAALLLLGGVIRVRVRTR